MKIPYGKQSITADDKEKVLEVLSSDFLTTGPVIDEFEKAFAKFVGAKYAIAVANGTAALHLAAKALGVKKETDVVTTAMSFAATSNCVLYNSGTPIFADPAEIRKRLTDKTTGIIPVHYTGLPCNLKEISEIAKENSLFVIEDACHAIGAKYDGTKIGDCKYSDLSVFSFHPVKQITTGEGGAITTNNDELNHVLRTLRTHGITKDKSEFKTNQDAPWYQEMHYLGFNYRLTDIQAALGLSQLSKVDQFIKRRREIAKNYLDFFEGLSDSIEVIPERTGEFHSYHLFVIKVVDPGRRRVLFDYLAKKGIFCQVHYIPIYWHPYYRENGYENEMLPMTEQFYERIISLPMYPTLTDEELDFVQSSIGDFFAT
jgi:perosamine synthetase